MADNPSPYDRFNVYYGDLHNHCGLSYGHGSFAEAMKNAKMQLDFVSITPHAAWPDMPRDDPDLDYLVAYHQYGFEQASQNWPGYLQEVETYHVDGQFITFPSYEWHSSIYGDHCIYFKSPHNKPLLYSADLPTLRSDLQRLNIPCLIIPHHIGYKQGFRGINWNEFSNILSPVVEIYSFHGASERSEGPYPYLYSMGPRHEQSCAQFGWAQGHIFGVIGSTDHHNAFPGSYGYGRMGVWAESLSRDALWAAIEKRRTYALTGDNIQLEFSLNHQPMGSICAPDEERNIEVMISAGDTIESVDVLHNNALIHRECPLHNQSKSDRYKIFFEMGWGEKQKFSLWQVKIRVFNGKILNVEPRFRGFNGAGFPEGDQFAFSGYQFTPPDEIQLTTRSWPNPTPRTPSTQGIAFEIEGDHNTSIQAIVNDQTYQHSLMELEEGSRSHYQGGFVSPAVCFHRAIPQSETLLQFNLSHRSPTTNRDWYYVRVHQVNDQMAWSSPIWVEKPL